MAIGGAGLSRFESGTSSKAGHQSGTNAKEERQERTGWSGKRGIQEGRSSETSKRQTSKLQVKGVKGLKGGQDLEFSRGDTGEGGPRPFRTV